MTDDRREKSLPPEWTEEIKALASDLLIEAAKIPKGPIKAHPRAADARAAELEASEYALGLQGLGDKLGAKAWTIHRKTSRIEVAPLLLKQRLLLRKSLGTGKDNDAEALRIEADMVAAWVRCLESLRVLWLLEGRGLEETG